MLHTVTLRNALTCNRDIGLYLCFVGRAIAKGATVAYNIETNGPGLYEHLTMLQNSRVQNLVILAIICDFKGAISVVLITNMSAHRCNCNVRVVRSHG